MIAIPPGLDDPSARRHIQVAIERHIERMRRDGMTPPAGLAVFAEWLYKHDVTLVEREKSARGKALNREAAKRYRQREREARGSSA